MNLGPLNFKNLSKNIPNRFRFDVESKSTQNIKVWNHHAKGRSGPGPDSSSPRAGPHLGANLQLRFGVVMGRTRRVPGAGPRQKYFTKQSVGIRLLVLGDDHGEDHDENSSSKIIPKPFLCQNHTSLWAFLAWIIVESNLTSSNYFFAL